MQKKFQEFGSGELTDIERGNLGLRFNRLTSIIQNSRGSPWTSEEYASFRQSVVHAKCAMNSLDPTLVISGHTLFRRIIDERPAEANDAFIRDLAGKLCFGDIPDLLRDELEGTAHKCIQVRPECRVDLINYLDVNLKLLDQSLSESRKTIDADIEAHRRQLSKDWSSVRRAEFIAGMTNKYQSQTTPQQGQQLLNIASEEWKTAEKFTPEMDKAYLSVVQAHAERGFDVDEEIYNVQMIAEPSLRKGELSEEECLTNLKNSACLFAQKVLVSIAKNDASSKEQVTGILMGIDKKVRTLSEQCQNEDLKGELANIGACALQNAHEAAQPTTAAQPKELSHVAKICRFLNEIADATIKKADRPMKRDYCKPFTAPVSRPV